MSIADNVAARREAQEIMDFIGDKSERFWEVLIELAQGKLPPKPVVRNGPLPMTDEEAQRFETADFPYGLHKGKEVGEAPIGYILFLAEGDAFIKDLRRYTASKVFARRQDEE